MENPTDFTTLLRTLMAQALRSNKDLAQLTGLSIYTIENWTGGKVQRPRFAADVLKIARALALDTQATSTLLAAGGHPPLAALHSQAQQTGDPHLVALLATWARADAASPAPMAAPHHQLRPPVADFVGRTHETAQLIQTLRSAVAQGRGALISGVHGMGGIGKTELAYAVAQQVYDVFPDAQLVLALRGSSAEPLLAEQALRTVIHALTPELRLPEQLEALEQHYRTALHRRRVLILADDARDAAQVRSLIPPIGSALLITSRMRFTLPGMATTDLDQLSADEAATLLCSICTRLTPAEAQALAQACGYLPLALRVSGSILRNDPALSAATYLARLANQRLRLAQLRDPDDAPLDVAASLMLSYAQLDSAAQQVFRQLGVLVADFSTELALAVVAAPATVAVEATLHHLLRRNLLMYDPGQARWRLHDLLRDVARHELENAGEWEATMWRYAEAAVQITQTAHRAYRAGGDGTWTALARFDAERSHIDAARAWGAAHTAIPAGDTLLVADARATDSIGHLRYDRQREIIPQMERALAAARRVEDLRGERTVLNRLGLIYLSLGNTIRAIGYLQERLAIAQAIGDRRDEGQALGNLGLAYVALGDPRQAIIYFEQDLVTVQAICDRAGEGATLSNLGLAYINLGDSRRALAALEQALAIARALGSRRGEGVVLTNLGRAQLALGNAHGAAASIEQSITMARALGDRQIEGNALHYLGEAYLALGDPRRAIELCGRARTLSQDVGDQRAEGYALRGLGAGYTALGDTMKARNAFEEALACLRTVGDRQGEAECCWRYGLARSGWGEQAQALAHLHAAVAYEKEIGHVGAVEHAALLARMEAGEQPPSEWPHPAAQRPRGASQPLPHTAAEP